MKGMPDGVHLVSGVAGDALPAPATVAIPVPPDFAHEEALKELNQLLISLLKNGMPEHEIAKRLMRYHPAQEGV